MSESLDGVMNGEDDDEEEESIMNQVLFDLNHFSSFFSFFSFESKKK